MITDKSKIFFWVFISISFIVCLSAIFVFRPIIDGDGVTYVEAIKVLESGNIPSHFVPNRILNTFFSLEVVILFSKVFGSLESGWLILNIGFYFAFNIVFYRLVRRIFQSDVVAFLAALFMATNYALISFGLDYWMDIGSWLFYISSLHFTLEYLQTGERRSLLYAAALVGIGGGFKEYAFLGIIPIAVALIYENWPRFDQVIKKALVPALLTIIPISGVYWYVYQRFNYTYANWLAFNHQHYVYSSRILEYIKSFGSLYTFSAFLVIGGACCFVFSRQELVTDKKIRIFVISTVLSFLPIFLWPGITQRTSFITVPSAIIMAGFLFKRYERFWYAFIPILVLCIAASFLMDSYILPNFNLASFL